MGLKLMEEAIRIDSQRGGFDGFLQALHRFLAAVFLTELPADPIDLLHQLLLQLDFVVVNKTPRTPPMPLDMGAYDFAGFFRAPSFVAIDNPKSQCVPLWWK